MPQGSTAEAVDISFFLLWKVGSEVPDSRSKLIGWPAECERIAGFAAIVLPGFRPFVSGPVHVSPLGPNPQIDNIGAPSARRALERPNRRGRRYRRLRNHCQRARPSGHLRCPYRGAYRHGNRHRQSPRNRWIRRLAGPASRNRDSACLAISGHRTYRRRGSPSRGNRELRSSTRRASVGVKRDSVLRLCPILLGIEMREGMQVSAAPVVECHRAARVLEEPFFQNVIVFPPLAKLPRTSQRSTSPTAGVSVNVVRVVAVTPATRAIELPFAPGLSLQMYIVPPLALFIRTPRTMVYGAAPGICVTVYCEN